MLPFYCRARCLCWTCLIWSFFIPFLYGVTSQVPSATRPSSHSTLFHSSPTPPHGPGLYSLTAGPLRHHTESPARQVCPPQLPVSALHPYCLCPPPCLSTCHVPTSWHTHTLDITLQYLSSTFSSQVTSPPPWSYFLYPSIYPILHLVPIS